MAGFIIPSVFTAVDKFSPVVARMRANMVGYEQKLNVLSARWERMGGVAKEGSSGMKDATQEVLGAVTVGAVTGLTAKAIMDYEDAIASFRTIVSDLNDTQFSAFEAKIASVAKTTRKSTIDVAQAFENIAGLNPEFAKTAESIGAVSAATITLAKASRMELGESAASLVGIMNQFNFEAEQSTRVINALASGQAVGAATINQTAAALTKFGATAKSANVTLEQSIALVEIFAAKGFFAEDAGFKLNSGIVKLQGATLGYKSGVFNLVDALTELKAKYDALGTAAAKDAYLQKVFDITQINTGRILLENIDNFTKTTAAVTGTNEAMKAAAINSNTLSNRLLELKNAWVTIATTSTTAGIGLSALTNTVVFLTDHIQGFVTIGAVWLGYMALWKGSILAMSAAAWAAGTAQAALNFVQGVGTVINGQYATSCFATIAGMNGMATASLFLELGLLGTLGVLGLVAGGVLLLANNFSYAADKERFLRGELQLTKDGFTEVKRPITEASIALDLYTEALTKWQEKTRSLKYDEYMKKHHFMTWYMQSFFKGTGEESQVNPTMPAMPNPKDFGGLDTSEANKPILDSLRRRFATDTVINMSVNVDKNGAVTASTTGGTLNINNGGMPSLSSTSR